MMDTNGAMPVPVENRIRRRPGVNVVGRQGRRRGEEGGRRGVGIVFLPRPLAVGALDPPAERGGSASIVAGWRWLRRGGVMGA